MQHPDLLLDLAHYESEHSHFSRTLPPPLDMVRNPSRLYRLRNLVR